jgi:acetylornithine deacetylase/succinyl-diaminopimelate desuccinylase-like protein
VYRSTWRVGGGAVLMVFVLGASSLQAQLRITDEDRALARGIYSDLVAIPSTSGSVETVRAAEMLADRLYDAGYTRDEVRVMSTTPTNGNLVARLEGTSSELRPVLLMGHLDVVPAVAEAWQENPFTLLEKDGYFLGRGTADNKAGVAMLVANLVRYRKEGYTPARDIIVVITGDEETGAEGIKWLLREHRDLIDAEFALNTDAGGGEMAEDGSHRSFSIQASEKMYTTFHLTTTNEGGHSSVPRPDNAIYDLARALTRISDHTFPVQLDEVTRGYFRAVADTREGQEAEDMRAVATDSPDAEAAVRVSDASPYHNSVLRTTCVATRLEAGHADNALPRSATATVNCRIFPGVSAESVRSTLEDVVGDPGVTFTLVNTPTRSPASPLREDVMVPLRDLVDEIYQGVPIIPSMSTGATDGNYVRNAGIPTYGISGIFARAGQTRAHGLDERIPVDSFYEAYQFWYEMVKRVASPTIIP